MDFKEPLRSAYTWFDVPLFEIGGTRVTAATFVMFVLVIVGSFVVSRLVQRLVARALRVGRLSDEGTIGVARNLVHYVVLIVGLGVALQTIGVDLSALFAAGAIFAIGIGFAMQNIVQNFVSGVILLLERAIKPGDILQVEGRVVRVVQIGLRSTIVRTRDEEELIVPNSMLVQSTVTNYTLRDTLYRVRTRVGVIYGCDLRLVRRTFEETAGGLSWRHAGRDPVIFLKEFGDSSVNFEISVWIDTPWDAERRQSELNEALWWALKEAGVTIAFPQIDVHFDPPVLDSLAQMARPA